MNTVLQLLQQTWVHSLGWTLVHFLWQGALLAALFALVRYLLRSASANTRYLAGCATLLVMLAVMAVTFSRQSTVGNSVSPPATFNSDSPAVAGHGPVDAISVSATLRSTTEGRHTVFASLRQFPRMLERMLPWLVSAWLLGVSALSTRLFAGWLKVRSLKTHNVQSPSEPWLAKLASLKNRLGISRPVHLLQSCAVEVPTIIGWLKPVILFPATTFSGLTPGQVESILAHELAHIRRHDYLINLLQCAMETLLFYHPVVWWVSRCVRQERENCCDDLAVQVCGDALQYARALATLEELRTRPVALALAADGQPLLKRIQRLLGQNTSQDTRARASGGLLSIILLLALFIALPLAHSQKAQSSDEQRTAPGQTPPASTNRLKVQNKVQTASETATNPALYTRTFKIDTNTFLSKLLELAQSQGRIIPTNNESASSIKSGRFGNNRGRPRQPEFLSTTTTENPGEILPAFLDAMKALAVDFTAPGRQVFYGDRLGILMVRGTLQELDKVEKFVQVLNQAPQQVVFEVKFAEINEDDGKAFYLEEVLAKQKFITKPMPLDLSRAVSWSAAWAMANTPRPTSRPTKTFNRPQWRSFLTRNFAK